MTEQEWLAATHPSPMLEFLHSKASDRRLRLFACACCRRAWHLLHDARTRALVLIAERYADQATDDSQVARVVTLHQGFLQGPQWDAAVQSAAEAVNHCAGPGA